MKIIRWFSPPENLRERFLSCFGNQVYCACLDSNGHTSDMYSVYGFLAGAAGDSAKCITNVNEWKLSSGRFLFGGMSYTLLQISEPIKVKLKPAKVELPEVFFFEPEFRIWQKKNTDYVEIEAENPEHIRSVLENCVLNHEVRLTLNATEPDSGISQSEYEDKVNKLKKYIFEGDVYEANLSRNMSLKAGIESPEILFQSWIKISPVPFSAYFKWKDMYIYSASPERFMAHQDGLLISQPIKGTSPRFQNIVQDKISGENLLKSEKDRAENLMIVDLVRNDLNKSCIAGSVIVPELCGLHTFPWVYHLISTITGRRRSDISPVQAILHAFPPGSMTGAPKVRAMEIIHELEPEGRGLFAGSLGYMSENGDFDFNVVIRTLIYDATQNILSYHAGGAVTIDSDASQEYEETVVKSRGLLLWLESVNKNVS